MKFKLKLNDCNKHRNIQMCKISVKVAIKESELDSLIL